MQKVLLHLGFPKSGSSALQKFLCSYPELSSGQQRYQYYALNKGRMLTGKKLKRWARFYPWGVVPTSCSFEQAMGDIKNAPPEYGTPILSRESWTSDIDRFVAVVQAQEAYAALDLIVYIRPQVDWFQSSWWQWHAWAQPKSTPEEIFEKQEKWETSNWERMLKKIEACPAVKNIHVRLYRKEVDIVSDFLSALEIVDPRPSAISNERANVSLGKNHISLYEKWRWIRKPHRSYPDFYLMKLLPGGEKAPWVVTPDLAEKIIDRYRESNKQLLERLTPKDQQVMMADERWWHTEAYAQRFLELQKAS